MSEFYENDRKAHTILDDVAFISGALSDLGIPAGDKLYGCVERLRSCLNEYRRIHQEDLDAYSKAANDGTANMMRAVLAMSQITTIPAEGVVQQSCADG